MSLLNGMLSLLIPNDVNAIGKLDNFQTDGTLTVNK